MSSKGRRTLGSAPSPPRLPLGPDDHVDGPADAPLELVMYGDFQCPYCTAAQGILRRVRDRLDGRLRFAFRHFPLDALHPDAQRAAEASEAAAAQGAFWEMHDALYGAARAARARRHPAAAGAIPGLDAERCGPSSSRACTPRGWSATSRAAAQPACRARRPSSSNGERHTGAFDAQSLIAALEGPRGRLAQLGEQLAADLAAIDGHRPAGQVDVQRLVDVDLELAAVELHGDGRVAAAQREGDGGAARARCPTTASPPPRARRSGRGSCAGPVAVQNETFVRFGKRGSCSIGGPSTRRGPAPPARPRPAIADRALRVADRDVLEAAAADLAGAVVRRPPG